MTVRRASNGAAVSKSTAVSNFGAAITQEAKYTVDQDYIKDYDRQGILGGVATFNDGRTLLWKQGQIVTQSEIDAAFAAATVTSITPATGTTAGGTAVTIKGTNFAGATGVTIGVAATSVVVVNDTTITCVTGATTSGAKNVVVADDSGNATLTNGYTYA
jgi:hypothetical protein